MEKIKVALIGFGGIARFHNAAYKTLSAKGVPVELVAVCDRNMEQFTKEIAINFGGGDSTIPAGARTYTDVDEMITHEDFDMADICLPSFLHKEYTVKLLSAGKHVLCEKPMALSYEDAEEMMRMAKKNDRRLMIGLDLHFTPEYLFLGDAIRSEEFGRLEYIHLWRNSMYPNWGAGDHFSNRKKSGGLVIDMHVHDVDIIRHFLGEPTSFDVLTYDNIPYCQTVTTLLYYPTLAVKIDSCWDKAHLTPFDAGYDAKFERAAVRCDGNKLTVIPYEREPYSPALTAVDGYAEEIAYMMELILEPTKKNEANPPEGTLATVRLMSEIQELGDKKAATMKA
ncbi:MAG: Gfo/Idh/MocA family oxidoreductase [Clostridia bacterium]|nr:Gfo/Idh/MocA family oxidoreductase [Clostridia bacterium]